METFAKDFHVALGSLHEKVDELVDRNERENRMYENLRRLRVADDMGRTLPLFRSIIQLVDRVREMRYGHHDVTLSLNQLSGSAAGGLVSGDPTADIALARRSPIRTRPLCDDEVELCR